MQGAVGRPPSITSLKIVDSVENMTGDDELLPAKSMWTPEVYTHAITASV